MTDQERFEQIGSRPSNPVEKDLNFLYGLVVRLLDNSVCPECGVTLEHEIGEEEGPLPKKQLHRGRKL